MYKNIPLLDGLNESELKNLKYVEKDYKKGDYIVHEGDKVSFFGTVLSGSIAVTTTDPYGNNNIILSGNTGFVFGGSLVVLERQHYPVSVVASSDCSIITFNSDTITSGKNVKLLFNLMRIMAQTNLDYRKKITILLQRKTREKILAYLYNEAKRNGKKTFNIPLDRQALADYLGVERSAMSAEISKLVNEGIIQTRKNRFTLLQL